MKTKLLITLLLALGLLTACATKFDPHSRDMSQVIHNPKTKADHEALAQHYEDVAQEMQKKVEEHKEILNQYEREPWQFGRQVATGYGVHCKNLIQIYSQAVDENLEMAKMHREMAQ